jgi:zinc protease
MQVLNRYVRPEAQTLALLTPATEHPAREQRDAALDLILPTRRTLPNGIPLIIREDDRLPITHVTVALLGGLLSEEEAQQGITQFMADLLTRGSSTRSGQQIAEAADALGASLSAFAGQNSFGLQGSSLASDTGTLLALLAECLLDSQFPENEITRQRARQLAQIRAQRESPLQLADEAVRRVLYPDHPYRWTPLGSEESIRQLQREDLLNHLRQHVRSGNVAISIFGPLSADEAEAQVAAAFAPVPDGPAIRFGRDIGHRELPRELVHYEPRQQTIYMMAFPGLDLRDEELTALEVLQTALSGLSSQLGMEVREKRGLVYFVGAFQRAGLDPGRFVLYAGTYPEAVPEMQHLMEAEIERLITEGLTDDELARAQEQLVGSFYSSLQDNFTMAQVSALNELYALGHAYEFDREARVRSVTRADIRRLAARIFDPEQRIISIVYPTTAKELAYDE